MDSQKIYAAIISRAVSRQRKNGEYYERHHITPRSMGGSDTAENLVYLTGREHYIAHWLLFKIHRNKQMACAWYAMRMNRDGKRYISKTFDYARKYSGGITSAENKARVWTKEMREKSSKARKGVFVRGSHQRARIVVNSETGEIYACMTDAADALGVTKAAIQNSITRNGRCKGVKFKHLD